MKIAFGSAAFLAAMMIAVPTEALAQDAQYVAPAEEMAEATAIMEVMFPAANREQMMLDIAGAIGSQAMNAIATGPIFDEPGIRAIFEKFQTDLPETLRPLFAKHLPKIFEANAIAYTREFTLDELRDIGVFARTPSGQRYFSNLQKFLNDPAVAAANQELFKEIGPLQQAQSTRVVSELQAFLAANPDVVERLEKAGVGRDR